ncbi:hypothetical protein AG4045_011692, partial [Apium graveolens]
TPNASPKPSNQVPTIIVPKLSNAGQGGIFGSYTQPAMMDDTPLCIQSQRFM